MVKIIIGKTSGFCNGVRNTIEMANKIISNSKAYCLGQIVHNERVMQDLENKGMITISSIEEAEDNSKVIIRAHGEVKEVYDRAKEKNIDVIDLTCGNVKIIRNKVSEKNKDSYIVLIGKKEHPEPKGVISFAKENAMILEDEEDIEELKEKYNKSKLNNIYIVSQTTFNSEKFDYLVEKIREEVTNNLEVNKTICNATSRRQKETEELSKKVDIMIIIGGKNSANTKELEVVAKSNCKEVYLIQDAIDLKNIRIDGEKSIGIMAGASTPSIVTDEVLNYLNSL